MIIVSEKPIFSNSKFNFDTDYFDLNIIDLKIEKFLMIIMPNYTHWSSSPIIKDTNVLENLIKLSSQTMILILKYR